jgi:hypothetical protein
MQPPRIRLRMPEDSHFPPRCGQGAALPFGKELSKGEIGIMTNKTNQGSAALLATLLLLGCASASHAATGAGGIWIPQPEPRAEIRMVAAGDLSDADRALLSQATRAATDAQPDTQSAVPAVASNADDQGSDTSTLVGKIFIGFGTLLTLASSAARMLMG